MTNTAAEMPGRNLPTFTRAQVASHNTKKSCYVTIDNNVYDVTDFLDSHPGGADLILDWAGKDIKDILQDKSSHAHSDAAYEVLEESLVGFLASSDSDSKGRSTALENNSNGTVNGRKVHPRTGMSCEEDLSKDTDIAADYKTHHFLDLSRPLFPQVWYGGFSKEFYLDQVHRPRHYKGGASAPLFGNFLEPLTKTAWWVVPTIWVPCVSYGVYLAYPGFDSILNQAGCFVVGVMLWTLVEYLMHRFLFHID